MPSDLQFANGNGNSTLIKGAELEDVKVIAEKLEVLLVKQQEELHELKRKHETAMLNILKELPEEIRPKVFSVCNLNIPAYKMNCETPGSTENSDLDTSIEM